MAQIRYHGIGKGTSPESPTDIDLLLPLSAELSTPGQRALGTLNGISGTNLFRSLATTTLSFPSVISEIGAFTAQPIGSGILIDRGVFTPIGVNAGVDLISEFLLLFPSGG
jgi:hypothetical protein